MNSCLICDDHAIMREALALTIMGNWPSAKITEAHDYPSALAALISLHEIYNDTPNEASYDIAIVDLEMPGASPIDGIKSIMDSAPALKILVVSGSFDNELMLILFEMGVSGIVPKHMTGKVIEAAIGLVLAGGQYLPPQLLAITGSLAAQTKPDAHCPILTYKQNEVLKHVARGLSNKEIARVMGVAPSTIQTHMARLFETLGVKSRAEAVHKANKLGL